MRLDMIIDHVHDCARIEDAEGVGEPRDTEQLSLNRGCSDSKLMVGLWASALLLGPPGKCTSIYIYIRQIQYIAFP